MVIADFEYNYINPSSVKQSDNNTSFLLSHCTEIDENKIIPCFFYGNLTNPFIAAKCFSTIAKTVRSHFAIKPGTLSSLRDPIVSVGSEQLRFEAFSSCNSVYARIDFLSDGIDGDFVASGCTNVDFNDNTVKAFNNVTRSEKLLLGIGSKDVHIITEKQIEVEKKVSLPTRWIKGLGNVQIYLSQMEKMYELNQLQTIQLFQGLPKMPTKSDYFIINRGRVQFSPIGFGNSVRIGGVHRLRLFEGLLPYIKSLSIYREVDEQCTAIVLHFDSIQLLFVFSASVYRGFSGEGKILEKLNKGIPKEWIVGINSLCKTNELFNPTLLSIENNIDIQIMDTLQALLSSIGLLGYDIELRQHFYRRLPFKLQRLLSLNPRLQNAQKLLTNDDVEIVINDNYKIEANVKGSKDVYHKVYIQNNIARCTCSWYTNNQNQRGLCKHVLAVKILLEN
jgi:hypothetical protein